MDLSFARTITHENMNECDYNYKINTRFKSVEIHLTKRDAYNPETAVKTETNKPAFLLCRSYRQLIGIINNTIN